MDTPKFFTIREAAAILRVSPITIKRRIIDKTINTVHFGKRILIPAAFIENLAIPAQLQNQRNQEGQQ
jgi:excisionase family DNA binding protein